MLRTWMRASCCPKRRLSVNSLDERLPAAVGTTWSRKRSSARQNYLNPERKLAFNGARFRKLTGDKSDHFGLIYLTQLRNPWPIHQNRKRKLFASRFRHAQHPAGKNRRRKP